MFFGYYLILASPSLDEETVRNVLCIGSYFFWKHKKTSVNLLTEVSLSTKRYWRSENAFSCVAWSGGGETPVGLARQSETLQAVSRSGSARAPRKANPRSGKYPPNSKRLINIP